MAEALKCPSCSAALEYPAGGGPSIRCPYCNTTVVIPAASDGASDFSSPFGGGSIDITRITDLLRAGNKIGAIRIYRQMHGIDLASAKAAIDAMAAGRPVAFNPVADATKIAATGAKFGCGLAIGIMVFVALLLTFIFHSVHSQLSKSMPATPSWVPPKIPNITIPQINLPPAESGFAHKVMEFGSEGIGAGQFKDARGVAIDGDGHIYVGEYSDGRIQAFDPSGKFLTEWKVESNKEPLLNLAADRHGDVYAVVSSRILRYDGATGEFKGQLDAPDPATGEYYQDVFVALNGDLYAIAGESHMIVLNSEGHIKGDVDLSQKVGEELSFNKIAVLPTGEIFAIDRSKGVFKFAADEHYVNRFAIPPEPGNMGGPGHPMTTFNIALDGKARVYISTNGPAIQVFDTNGSYLDSIGGNDVAFGLAIDDQNNVYASFRNKHSIRKFALDKP